MINLEVVRLNDITIPLTFTDGNSNPINISSWKIIFTVKKLVTDTDTKAVIQIFNTTHDNAGGGVSHITISNSLSNIPNGVYFYDVKIIDSASKAKTISWGTILVDPSITNAVS